MTIPQCPVCWSGETRIAYSAGHHQYQCDNCGYYGHVAGSDEEALEMVFKHIPNALGMLLEASSAIELLMKNQKTDAWTDMVEPIQRRINAALKWKRDQRNEQISKIMEKYI